MSCSDHTTHRGDSAAGRSSVAGVFVLVLALALGLVAAPSALAGKPTGEYAVFKDCPLGATGVNQCVYIETTSGELKIGDITTPIVHTITLQGGLIVTEKEETFVAPSEGQTLSKTPQTVPGGLTIKGLPEEVSRTLFMTMELVGSVALSRTNLAAGKGVALKLPVRLHLENEFLGTSCEIGSSSSPVTLALTTGTTSPPKPNNPITGKSGERESKEEGNLTIYKGDSLLENAFSVPEASGCGSPTYEFIIDPLVDEMFDLPSAGGHSTAILNGTSRFASAEAVRKSE
jgi:hypothetical protein